MKRPFDMSKFRKRHIALRLAYIGTEMDGFASQESTINTVEVHGDVALKKLQRCVVHNSPFVSMSSFSTIYSMLWRRFV